ncbi:hypothetical protein [Paramicrobacterium fandaimingii]|uniref:hypothetical protein n=1 Tax=Paramicrobacterium fandaimingii TaxID=2708079 RepID=UPI00141DA934|nr:hypothetical protein [Microbacterium fandaimingii]
MPRKGVIPYSSAITAAITAALMGLVISLMTGNTIGLDNLFSAQSVKSSERLAELNGIQQQWVAVDGRYAPSIEAMGGDDTFGRVFTPREGQQFAYAVNSSGDRYIAAEKLPSGSVVIRSDSVVTASCHELDNACIDQVTDDPELLGAIPEFVTY